MAIDAPWLTGQQAEHGIFEDRSTLGTDGGQVAVSYDPVTQIYAVRSEATAHDQTVWLWRRMEGDFILHARANVANATSDVRAGLLVRSGLESGALEVRVEQDRANDVLQLERADGTILVKQARFGDTFDTSGTPEGHLDGPVYVGIYVTIPAGATSSEAQFSNVRIVVPATPDHSPWTNPLGSHLEVLDIAAGTRQIIHSEPFSFEAPNWTPDGKTLIYNSRGLLHRFDLGTGAITQIDTGFAKRSNNDHVLTFDGTLLGISDHTEEGHSIVYVVPAEGGTPRRITALGPSYLHGWSPDNKYLVYTGARDDEYDIYRISVDGGEEEQLTTAVGLDDGSEYTPDGRYIY